MSKLNTKEFSSATGIKIGTVRAHISREKLYRDEDGYIDTELEKNRLYIKTQTKGKGLYNVEKSESEPSTNSEEAAQKKIKFNDKRSAAQKAKDKIYEDIDLRKKRAELDNAERTAELKKLEIQKKAGKLLPIELVQKIMTINIQTIFRTFDNESDRVAGIFTEVFGGGRSELADITKMMRESLADAIEKAKEDSLAEITQAVDEYKETRSRGERK